MDRPGKDTDTYIQEPSRAIPVTRKYQVIVAGGGIAGVAASIAAARSGAKTCLVEKMFSLGGLATLGNVIKFLPICDGLGHKITGGLTEELLKLSVAGDPEGIPSAWRHPDTQESRSARRYLTIFNPAKYALDLEKLCIESGVDLFYDTRLCSSIVADGTISAVIVENKSGRFALSGDSFIDATGDADLCFFSGAPTVSINSNVRAGWYFYTSESGTRYRTLSMPFNRDASLIEGDKHYRGDSGKDTTSHIIDTRELMREDWLKLKERDSSAELIRLSEVPGFRMTRRLSGDSTIEFSNDGTVVSDGVGWFPSWREAGLVWNLPLSSLYTSRVKNLLSAGRCISAAGAAWDITRVIPVCTLTGEIAGVAAAQLCASGGGTVSALNVDILRAELAKHGNIVQRRGEWE